jgi:AraC-like DNA-binding protein
MDIKGLAARLYVNHCHLARLFTASLGLAPMAYLARCRAERSAEFLLRTNSRLPKLPKKLVGPTPTTLHGVSKPIST